MNMNMNTTNYKAMVMVFMLIFALSFFTTVTSSRSLKAITYEISSTQQLYNDKFEQKKERILDMQLQDYGSTGANCSPGHCLP
ncbi:hypothetical protein CASFOL_028033 [Castilleja foliolosa]|uniref:Uncharacterized protein n=1 Tax=Castilleja foliolosa TaxID=1961234 RepID=A0ABD3CHN3_9LAMI